MSSPMLSIIWEHGLYIITCFLLQHHVGLSVYNVACVAIIMMSMNWSAVSQSKLIRTTSWMRSSIALAGSIVAWHVLFDEFSTMIIEAKEVSPKFLWSFLVGIAVLWLLIIIQVLRSSRSFCEKSVVIHIFTGLCFCDWTAPNFLPKEADSYAALICALILVVSLIDWSSRTNARRITGSIAILLIAISIYTVWNTDRGLVTYIQSFLSFSKATAADTVCALLPPQDDLMSFSEVTRQVKVPVTVKVGIWKKLLARAVGLHISDYITTFQILEETYMVAKPIIQPCSERMTNTLNLGGFQWKRLSHWVRLMIDVYPLLIAAWPKIKNISTSLWTMLSDSCPQLNANANGLLMAVRRTIAAFAPLLDLLIVQFCVDLLACILCRICLCIQIGSAYVGMFFSAKIAACLNERFYDKYQENEKLKEENENLKQANEKLKEEVGKQKREREELDKEIVQLNGQLATQKAREAAFFKRRGRGGGRGGGGRGGAGEGRGRGGFGGPLVLFRDENVRDAAPPKLTVGAVSIKQIIHPTIFPSILLSSSIKVIKNLTHLLSPPNTSATATQQDDSDDDSSTPQPIESHVPEDVESDTKLLTASENELKTGEPTEVPEESRESAEVVGSVSPEMPESPKAEVSEQKTTMVSQQSKEDLSLGKAGEDNKSTLGELAEPLQKGLPETKSRNQRRRTKNSAEKTEQQKEREAPEASSTATALATSPVSDDMIVHQVEESNNDKHIEYTNVPDSNTNTVDQTGPSLEALENLEALQASSTDLAIFPLSDGVTIHEGEESNRDEYIGHINAPDNSTNVVDQTDPSFEEAGEDNKSILGELKEPSQEGVPKKSRNRRPRSHRSRNHERRKQAWQEGEQEKEREALQASSDNAIDQTDPSFEEAGEDDKSTLDELAGTSAEGVKKSRSAQVPLRKKKKHHGPKKNERDDWKAAQAALQASSTSLDNYGSRDSAPTGGAAPSARSDCVRGSNNARVGFDNYHGGQNNGNGGPPSNAAPWQQPPPPQANPQQAYGSYRGYAAPSYGNGYPPRGRGSDNARGGFNNYYGGQNNGYGGPPSNAAPWQQPPQPQANPQQTYSGYGGYKAPGYGNGYRPQPSMGASPGLGGAPGAGLGAPRGPAAMRPQATLSAKVAQHTPSPMAGQPNFNKGNSRA